MSTHASACSDARSNADSMSAPSPEALRAARTVELWDNPDRVKPNASPVVVGPYREFFLAVFLDTADENKRVGQSCDEARVRFPELLTLYYCLSNFSPL
eukprot:SAG11_NODE_197_length_12691_cov_20.904145_12_plen_99_part_00